MENNQVLLVHGIFRKQGVFQKMSAYLTAQGWQVYSFNLEQNSGKLGLENLAEQVKEYIDKNFAAKQTINLVGLSMGGIVSRYYVQRLGGRERVQRFITISSPHQGTWMAYVLPFKIYVQMRPGSEFLQDLNRDAAMLEQVNFTSIWTPYDFIIVPANSSQLGVGKEIKVSVFAHAMMVRNMKSLQAVADALKMS
ncbi:MAG: alpha/beta fold hydrolase [Gomphosphaeria aponina SAG 52.96 = DSM 107014]|uniref:Alpha/beta fold hydrolase n=1 Tax=Gomphosphaeria aponina SAG 52.96 = DSM 107014 TaxID=1521640 RepID=A0A941JN42_9CHRO|nr:alpha/beta fold hydrolase [Gomphosphaeria aponina SAG 52.96 = DSM 107014]